MSKLTVLVVVLFAALAACATAPESEPPRAGSDRISPLGLGQPDPELILQRSLDAFERRDFDTFLSFFAFVDQQGRRFVPRGNASLEGQNTELMAAMAASLRNFLSSDYVTVQYGEPTPVETDPPVSEVPMTLSYHFDDLSPQRREVILEEVNRLILQRPGAKAITWDQYRRQLENLPRTDRRRFIYLEGAWRLDAGWRRP